MYKTKTFAAFAMSIVALLSGGCGGGSSSGSGTPEASAVSLQVSSDSSRYLTKISDLADYELPTSKPVFWYPLVQSQHEFFVSGWVEDGFCVNNCEQRFYATDYSIQALGIEAVLQAVASQTRFQTVGFALNASYWHADVVMPSPGTTQAAFPNISQTIRNKPAEAIVKHWFGSD